MKPHIRMRWTDVLQRWLVPNNLRRILQTQGAMDAVFAFAFTVFFFTELAHPGTFTPRDALTHMTKLELRRYLGFYLWYAFMYLMQLTVSLLLYLDVRNVKSNVSGKRRTILVFLVFSPTLGVNLVLSAANVMYFPWAPLGVLYAMHTLFVTPYWLYAFRYYHWLGDGELVHFEAPLVVRGRSISTVRAGPSGALSDAVAGPSASDSGVVDDDGVGYAEPPTAETTTATIRVAQLVPL